MAMLRLIWPSTAGYCVLFLMMSERYYYAARYTLAICPRSTGGSCVQAGRLSPPKVLNFNIIAEEMSL